MKLDLIVPNIALPPEPFVIDVGAYQGDFATLILQNFPLARMVLFEPQPDYYEICKKRFCGFQPRVIVEKKAIGGISSKRNLYLRGEGSSFWQNWADSEDKVETEVITLTEYLKGILRVDLLKLNCEGAEYEIVRELVANGTIKKIDKLLIQFHSHYKLAKDTKTVYFENRRNLYQEAQEILAETHERVQNWKWQWELWGKKDEKSAMPLSLKAYSLA